MQNTEERYLFDVRAAVGGAVCALMARDGAPRGAFSRVFRLKIRAARDLLLRSQAEMPGILFYARVPAAMLSNS